MDKKDVRYTHTHTIEFYSAIKNNKICHLRQHGWLEGIMLSEISQTEKDKYCMMSLIYEIYKTEQASEYNKKRNIHRCREKTSGYQ